MFHSCYIASSNTPDEKSESEIDNYGNVNY